MSYDLEWDGLNPADFEEFVFWLVTALGYDDPRRVSGAGDEGEDVVAFYRPLPKIPIERRKWVFQCKHVKRITKVGIEAELANFAAGEIDTWVLVTTAHPSTQMRRWLDNLRGSGRYSFHIEAWWRDDIERITREMDDALIRVLPSRLSDALGLPRAERQVASLDLSAFSARCRDYCNSQIERFAKSKYIPNLYVHREIENDIQAFLQDEQAIARSNKSDLRKLILRAQDILEKGPPTFLRSFGQIPRAENKRDEDTRQSYLRNFREKVRRESEPWLTSLSDILAHVLTRVDQLSDTRYVAMKSDYTAIEDVANSCISWFSEIPHFPEPDEIVPEEHRSREPRSATVLSAGRYTADLGETLHQIIARTKAPFKPSVLIIDRAGSGKTNLVCHLVARLSEQHPVLLLFGRQPTLGPSFLVDEILARTKDFLPMDSNGVISDLDQLLEQRGDFLTVFIDGINENRELRTFDAAISRLLSWSVDHRIKVILTCRDIYWNFFDQDEWTFGVQKIIREEIREFNPAEYESALPLYLAHFNIRCDLADEAKRACQHPLLLRFFCEAYGNTHGKPVNLGEVRDIRLKELFNIYIERKTEQIRKALGDQNPARVMRYLLQLSSFMFRNSTSSMDLVYVADATGDTDTSGPNSLYLHLLDEDIIIEEQPGGLPDQPRIAFVYEEFMEYLLARALISAPADFGIASSVESFELLDELEARWTNARGVGEYVCLMLLDNDATHEHSGVAYLTRFARAKSSTWREAYWSVVGKLTETRLTPAVMDTLPISLEFLPSARPVQLTLANMKRYSTAAARNFASVLIWSAALPSVITWTMLEQLPRMNEEEVRDLGFGLVARCASPASDPPGRFNRSALLEASLTFLTIREQEQIIHLEKIHGKPRAAASDATQTTVPLVKVLWKAFPSFAPMLLNGLFDRDEEVQVVCADRIRWSRVCRPQLAVVTEMLATHLQGSRVGEVLNQTSWHLKRPLIES